MTAVRIVARIVDAPFAVLVHGTRAWRAVTRTARDIGNHLLDTQLDAHICRWANDTGDDQ